MVAASQHARPAPRYIQAWNHAGDARLIHAAIDQPSARQRIALGCMGIFTLTACRAGGDHGLPFMRLERSDADSPAKGADGWITNWDYRGRDWALPLEHGSLRRCQRCVRALRAGDAA